MQARMVHGLAALLMLLAVLATIAPATGVKADGVIVVDPPECDPVCPEPFYIGEQLVVKNHHVEVTIDDQLAATKVLRTYVGGKLVYESAAPAAD